MTYAYTAAIKPTVRVEGNDVTDLTCLQIEDACGQNMSRAILRYTPGRHVDSPITLQAHGTPVNYGFGQRVVIYQGTSSIYFHGWLMRRQDQGAADSVLWTAYDDKLLLRYIAVRGCLIRDVDGTLKFSSRHPTQFNPGGFWNCTGYTYNDTLYPVFTADAHRTLSYESPTESFDGETLPTDGTNTAWTPRRALQYLQLIATISADGTTWPDGMSATTCSALNQSYLVFDRDQIDALEGFDPAVEANDPLDRKLPDTSVQGMTMLGALYKILDYAGTHTFRILYDSTTITAGLSKIWFTPVGYTAVGSGNSVAMQRGGRASDALGTIFDFNLDEDATEANELVFVEGDVARVETEVQWTGSIETSKIIPAWNSDEELGFLRVINGGDTKEAAEAAVYATIPETFGEAQVSSWIVCNGQDGKPFANARSPEAIALAREMFPTVYRAWRLNGPNISDIVESPISGSIALNSSRPILPEQLQFFLRDLSAGTTVDNWMITRLPIRVQMYVDSEGGVWRDVPKDVSIRVTDDGTIWIDGIAESMNTDRFCIYDGDLQDYVPFGEYVGGSNDYFKPKKLKLNVAFPTDTRVSGSATKTISGISSTLRYAIRGAGLMRYIDSGDSYKLHYQYNSSPSANEKLYGGSGGSVEGGTVDAPLTREVPPGSEAIHAEYEAQRQIAKTQHFRRVSNWRQWGIRTGIRGGDWLEKVYLQDPELMTIEYKVNAHIPTVHWDFEKQITTLGGLIGEYD